MSELCPCTERCLNPGKCFWVQEGRFLPFLARLVRKIGPADENGCWPWQGTFDGDRYGMFPVGSGMPRLKAHRAVYLMLVGPIPEGLQLDHLCRNPSCVNPEHLEPVTPRENTLRGYRSRGLKTHCKQGHPFNEENTIYRECRRDCRQCHNERTRIRRAQARSEK